MIPRFYCGHFKTKANTRRFTMNGKNYERCKLCHQEDNRVWHWKQGRLGQERTR